ncbi:MAG: hypothetical protein JMDDDDMK_00356 [Acidobacteria bacterium]|nr:hypothetical protein [Acidobacteriota bacterium]
MRDESFIPAARESFLSRHQQAAFIVFTNRGDGTVGQTIFRRVDSELFRLKFDEAVALGSDPERPRAVFAQISEAVARKVR